jgi:hypothetical protein
LNNVTDATRPHKSSAGNVRRKKLDSQKMKTPAIYENRDFVDRGGTMRLVVVATASHRVAECAQQPQDETDYQHDHSERPTGTLRSRPMIINTMPKRIMTPPSPGAR